MSEMKSIDLGLKTAYDELFMNDQERAEAKLPRIYEIPLSEIDPFPDHPFQVRMDEDMDQLVESIKERGLITPVTVRKKEDGRYEIVSGHRRTKACELAGLSTVKAEIKELNRDEAIILMVESNLQRSVILPSEKAKSYKMRLDAMKRQAGRPAKENVSPLETHLRSSEILAQSSPDSRAQIDRYIRLNELITPVLDNVNLIGRLTRDPEVRYGASTQMAVARFTIAINRGKDRNGKDAGSDFPNIVCFGNTAELVEKYIFKGRLVAIQGKIQTGSYEKDGRKVYTTEVVADKVEFLDKAPGNCSGGNENENKSGRFDIPEGFENLDDIPF